MKKVIAIDFDGTLCKNEFPNIGVPNEDIIRKVKREKEKGADLILWTCREGKLLDEAVEWCKSHGLVFDSINDSTNEWKEMFGDNPRKVGATEYWDDRAKNLDYLHNASGDIEKNFISNIQKCKEENDVSYSYIADVTGVSAAQVSRIMHLERRPSLKFVERVAEAFGKTTAEMLANTDEK